MQLGMGACTNVVNQVGMDSVTGEPCVQTGVGTQLNVPMTGGAVYYDASGNPIVPLTVPTPSLISGVSNTTLLLIAAGVVGLALMGGRR
jgi:hypothetical protein